MEESFKFNMQNFAPQPPLQPKEMIIRKEDKSEFIQFSATNPDFLTLIGHKGYRSAFAPAGFNEGCFYFEVLILEPQQPLPFVQVTPSVRIGFCDIVQQDKELPLGGYEKSYCYSSQGKLITKKEAIEDEIEKSKPGDVLGALIDLAPPKPAFIRKANQEDQEVSDNSKIKFFKNGKLLGQIDTVYEGTYSAAVSLYMHAQVRLNFGHKDFKFPPKAKEGDWKPYCTLLKLV